MRTPLTRRGLSLVELLIAVVVGGIVAAAITGVLNRQQRFYSGVGALVAQRTALRDATGIVPGELRALAPRAGDVIAFSDSSLEIHATIGTAIACDTVPGGGAIHLAPDRIDDASLQTTLAAFSAVPDAGDVALIFDDRGTASTMDDGWSKVPLAGVSSGTGLCAASPFADAIGVGSRSLRLRIAAGQRVAPTIGPGAVVRVLRRVRYRFYRAGTGEWYLGYSAWAGSGYEAVQPVSGPFAPYRANARGGFALRYFDTVGTELATGMDPGRVARVEVVARGVANAALSASERTLIDSQRVIIRVRNP